MTKEQELLKALKVPPLSLHIQDLRANMHTRLTLITTFGSPVTSISLLSKLRQKVSVNFMANNPYETLADIQAAKYTHLEILALEAKVDTAGGGAA